VENYYASRMIEYDYTLKISIIANKQESKYKILY